MGELRDNAMLFFAFIVAAVISAITFFVWLSAIVFLFINEHIWPVSFMVVGLAAVYYFS